MKEAYDERKKEEEVAEAGVLADISIKTFFQLNFTTLENNFRRSFSTKISPQIVKNQKKAQKLIIAWENLIRCYNSTAQLNHFLHLFPHFTRFLLLFGWK